MKNLKLPLSFLAVIIAAVAAFAFTPRAPKDTTVLYFDGNVAVDTEVKDETRWAEDNTVQNCNGANQACSMTVDITDVTGTAGHRVLNGTRIDLGATSTGSGYIPFKNGGTSPNGITPHNKN